MSLSANGTGSPPKVDAMVVFGITGDLAQQMTFRALYRLERDGRLDFPIMGVGRRELDDEQLRARARDAIAEHEDRVDEEVFSRFAARLSYVRGDIGEDDLHERLTERLRQSRCTAFYLETPPTSFAQIVEGLDRAGALKADDRVLIEKPFGYDVDSSRELAEDLHRHLAESQIFRIDHFLGKLGVEELLRLRFGNVMLEPIWNSDFIEVVELTMAEASGLDGRGSFYEPVGQLRDVVVNHLMQLLAAATMEPPSGGDRSALQKAALEVFRAVADADPQRYVRGQYEGYRDLDGVDAESETETFAALELRIDNRRWHGVPFLIRTGKCLPVKATELRIVFRAAAVPSFLSDAEADGDSDPESGSGSDFGTGSDLSSGSGSDFSTGSDSSSGPGSGSGSGSDSALADGPGLPSQIVLTVDPQAGVAIRLKAGREDHSGWEQTELTTRFGSEGEGAPTPYQLLLGAAIQGDRSYFVPQENVDECWRIVQPLLDSPGPVRLYARDSWGPDEVAELAEPYGGWRGPSARSTATH